MDRVRRVMLIAALVVDVGRRLPRRCGSAVPPSARLIAPTGRSKIDARLGGRLALIGRDAIEKKYF